MHAVIAPWSTGTPVLDPQRLAAVRVEPVLHRRRAALVLDLCLIAGDALTVIPNVLVEPALVVDRDRDPLVFPFGTPGDDAFASAIAGRVLPHLEPLAFGGASIAEHVVRFAPAPAFDAAREAGCFGAAPLRDALARLAPYRFARRFVRGHSVRIDAPDAVGGWALLRDIAAVEVASERRVAAELAWYGDAPAAAARADVAIVSRGADAGDAPCVVRVDADPGAPAGTVFEAADPVPLDVSFSFDPAEAPPRRWFAVERVPEPTRSAPPMVGPAASGGSSGRIAVVLGRADWSVRPSADVDEARALVTALRAEGFDAFVADTADELRGVDLVHVLGTRDGRRARAIVDAARRDGVPVAVHAYDEDAASGGWWGAEVTRHCFEYGSDERDLQAYLAMLARRAVAVGDARGDAPYAPAAAAADDAAAALRDASLVFAASAAEADAIRARTGRRGPTEVVAPLLDAVDRAPIGAMAGADPFVLAHAPIGSLGNQLLLARCAHEAGVPLVLAGPVADASYLERVREFGGPSLVVLAGEPSPGVAASLRANAAVVADAAWIGDGSSRLAASLLAGAVLVVADRRRFDLPARARRFDPADAAALTRALGEAWDEALRARRPGGLDASAFAPEAALRAIVRGYAAVAAAP